MYQFNCHIMCCNFKTENESVSIATARYYTKAKEMIVNCLLMNEKQQNIDHDTRILYI